VEPPEVKRMRTNLQCDACGNEFVKGVLHVKIRISDPTQNSGHRRKAGIVV
jgi:hypothetical protein